MDAMDFKYVTIGDVDFEDVTKLQNCELEEMAEEIEDAAKRSAATFAAAKELVRLDLKRRADEALESLRRIGGALELSGSDEAAPKGKRGRKKKGEAAATEEVTNGQTEPESLTLDA
jgi:hypothetical protein